MCNWENMGCIRDDGVIQSKEQMFSMMQIKKKRAARLGKNHTVVKLASFIVIILVTLRCVNRKMICVVYFLMEEKIMDKNVNVITDPDGKKIVLINDVRFKGKTRQEWNEIEMFLKEYVGKYYEIAETAEIIYIGKEFPDEFTHGKDKTSLNRAGQRAKANASQAIGELIRIAENKNSTPDYCEKHGDKARYGWYRYDTRLALPAYDDYGEIVRYNIYKLRMLVRHDADGKLYLYDFLRTKKETNSPLW